MNRQVRARARRDLDEDLRIFRSRRVRRSKWSWLRGVRQVLGMRVSEVAERLKVSPAEVYRREMSEAQDTITLCRLRAAAEAMDCELIYAIAPRYGTLEALAEQLADERRKKAKRKRRRPGADPYGVADTVKSLLVLAEWDHGPK